MKMMMNLFMSRYALLLLLLIASLAVEVSSTNVKNGMGNTNTMPKDDDNKVNDGTRMLTGEDDKLPYSQIYIAVTQAVDFVRSFPNGGNIGTYLDDFDSQISASARSKVNAEFQIQGSSTTQKGSIFDSSSIEVVNVPDGVEVFADCCGRVGRLQFQFAGKRKLKFTPSDDSSYFFHGQCIVTSGFLEPSVEITTRSGDVRDIPQPVIRSQSCRLNLCLGGGGFSCIAIYSGSASVFNFGKGIILNNEYVSGKPLTFEAPPLPPPFPGTIIGGTGAFEGIEGSVTISTIAGTTGPIFNFDSGSIVNIRTFGRGSTIGSIVQVISVKSNMPLPTGP